MDVRRLTERRAKRFPTVRRPAVKLLLKHLLPYLADFIKPPSTKGPIKDFEAARIRFLRKSRPRPPRGFSKLGSFSGEYLALCTLWQLLRPRRVRDDMKLCL